MSNPEIQRDKKFDETVSNTAALVGGAAVGFAIVGAPEFEIAEGIIGGIVSGIAIKALVKRFLGQDAQ